MSFPNENMKQIGLVFICVIALLSSCRRKGYEPYPVMEMGSDWHEGADTLIGCFDGIEIDTLVSEPISELTQDPEGSGWHWRIRCLSGRLPSIELKDWPRMTCRLVKEGDLDGNKTDEFGILSEYPSNWEGFYIYTFSQNRWCYLTDPITVFELFLNEELWLEEVASPSGNPDYIKVRMSKYEDPEFIILDTLFRVKKLPIN